MVSDIIWTLSLQTMRFTYISPSIVRTRGFTPDEAMALTLEETLTPQSLEDLTKVIAEELARNSQERVDPTRSRTGRFNNSPRTAPLPGQKEPRPFSGTMQADRQAFWRSHAIFANGKGPNSYIRQRLQPRPRARPRVSSWRP